MFFTSTRLHSEIFQKNEELMRNSKLKYFENRNLKICPTETESVQTFVIVQNRSNQYLHKENITCMVMAFCISIYMFLWLYE